MHKIMHSGKAVCWLLICILHVVLSLPLKMDRPDQNSVLAETKHTISTLQPLTGKKEGANDAPDLFTQIIESNKESTELMLQGDIALKTGHSTIECDGDACYWQKSSSGPVYVPYSISPHFGASSRSLIETALEEFSTLTCVMFVNRTTEEDYLEITSGNGCWAYIGKIGGGQTVSVAESGCITKGIVQHEVQHSLGFHHEHTRSDRDQYVDIQLQYISEDDRGNFVKLDTNNLGLPYDYASVMHYGRFAFSNTSGQPSIVPKPDPKIEIGQRHGLSNLDVAKLNKLYQCETCSNLLTRPNGTLASANYPANYPKNASCLWLIRTDGDKVALQFEAFDLPASPNCGSDHLNVYDGSTRSSRVLIERACGQSPLPLLVASGMFMLVEFVSDGTATSTGFNASYNSVKCGGTFTSDNGVVTSPGYPGLYPNSLDCVWSILSPVGHQIELQFTTFDIERFPQCGCDYLQVNDGASTSAPVLGKYCGSQTPKPVTSAGNVLVLNFHSDVWVNEPGFSATYSFNTCSNLLTRPNGTLASANYPSNYPKNASCLWLIHIDEDKVALQFEAFDLPASPNCGSDHLNVYDGSTRSSRVLIERACGQAPLPLLVASGMFMLVEFVSDGTATSTGFNASYSSVKCGGTFTSDNGVVTSPGYPGLYPNSLDCVWSILSPVGHQIELQFTAFDIERFPRCGCDYLQVNDGASTFSPVLGKYCGSKTPKPVTSAGNVLVLHFHSDFWVNEPGFSATYTFI